MPLPCLMYLKTVILAYGLNMWPWPLTFWPKTKVVNFFARCKSITRKQTDKHMHADMWTERQHKRQCHQHQTIANNINILRWQWGFLNVHWGLHSKLSPLNDRWRHPYTWATAENFSMGEEVKVQQASSGVGNGEGVSLSPANKGAWGAS